MICNRPLWLLCLLFACLGAPVVAEQKTSDWSTVLAPTAPQYNAEYWLGRLRGGEKASLELPEINARNAHLLQTEKTMLYWPNWPESLPANTIRERIAAFSKLNISGRMNARHEKLGPETLDAWQHNLALDQIKPSSDAHFALIVKRSALRLFPTYDRVIDASGGPDIDRLQESALFPTTPVAVLHTSRDNRWRFVQSDHYAGWVETEALAMASRNTVMAYSEKSPRRWISQAQARMAYVPYTPELSELSLDMGVSLPWLKDWPLNQTVNGQSPLAAWVVEVPTRDQNGRLELRPALLPRAVESHAQPLTASKANVIRQSFKFLGERYGWGHDYKARDCSGFVSEVYRSMGFRLPRNTSDQQRSTNFKRMAFAPEWLITRRMAAIDALKVGDLVFIPGHVMLIIGHDQHGPWVIHDVLQSSVPLSGQLQSVQLNGVSVTPLRALYLADGRSYIEAITAVQRIISERR